MAVQQYFQEAAVRRNLCKEDESSLNKWKSVSDEVAGADSNLPSGLDCNICLEVVHDPVVTLCGHLYCWPCIYKWIHFQSISVENPDQQHQAQCPVCKAEVSSTTLVPLYGRGQTTKPSKGKAPQVGIIVPRRPSGPCRDMLSPTTTPSPRPTQQLHHHSHQQPPQPYYPNSVDYVPSPSLNLGVSTTSSTMHPIIGMFGEMVCARVFGNSVTNTNNYTNSYHLAANSSPRVRRHEMQADRSLSRICFFLFCCIFLCLVLF